LMLTSFYLVLPVIRITFRHALIGGISATVLWEVARRFLVWYYASLSMVNIIYGSIATVIVTLLSIEVSALIILFGAQIIAEFENRGGTSGGGAESRFETWSVSRPDDPDRDKTTPS
jgi:membrane protein